MVNHSLDLQVLNPKEKGFIGPSIAHIYIKSNSKNEDGTIYISPQCVSLSEIEYECDRLVAEIENIRKKAQKYFRKK